MLLQAFLPLKHHLLPTPRRNLGWFLVGSWLPTVLELASSSVTRGNPQLNLVFLVYPKTGMPDAKCWFHWREETKELRLTVHARPRFHGAIPREAHKKYLYWCGLSFLTTIRGMSTAELLAWDTLKCSGSRCVQYHSRDVLSGNTGCES